MFFFAVTVFRGLALILQMSCVCGAYSKAWGLALALTMLAGVCSGSWTFSNILERERRARTMTLVGNATAVNFQQGDFRAARLDTLCAVLGDSQDSNYVVCHGAHPDFSLQLVNVLEIAGGFGALCAIEFSGLIVCVAVKSYTAEKLFFHKSLLYTVGDFYSQLIVWNRPSPIVCAVPSR